MGVEKHARSRGESRSKGPGMLLISHSGMAGSGRKCSKVRSPLPLTSQADGPHATDDDGYRNDPLTALLGSAFQPTSRAAQEPTRSHHPCAYMYALTHIGCTLVIALHPPPFRHPVRLAATAHPRRHSTCERSVTGTRVTRWRS